MTPALELLAAWRVVPVLTIDDARLAPRIAVALRDGGIPCAEITLRTPAGLAAIRLASEVDGFAVAAGTVRSPDDLDAAVEAGARLIVSPGLDEDVVERAVSVGIPIVPGVATATELQHAVRRGLTAVKVFPVAQLGGPAFLAALAAPFPEVAFLPSGGVTIDDAAEYAALTCVPAVSGSWMVPAAAVRDGDVDTIRRRAHETIRLLEVIS